MNACFENISNYKYLWFLILLYCMIIAMSNWFDPRIISIFGVSSSAGALIYAMTFSIIALIVHVYGRYFARLAIYFGFFSNIVFMLYGILIISLPSPEFAQENNIAFSGIFLKSLGVIIASFSAYLVSEPLASLLFSKSFNYFNSSSISYFISTISACIADSFIFIMIGFYIFGDLTLFYALQMFLHISIFKISIDILLYPCFEYFTNCLKAQEKKC